VIASSGNRGSAPNPAGAVPLRPPLENQNLSMKPRPSAISALPLVGTGHSKLVGDQGINLSKTTPARYNNFMS
jgi:hypothetical protein